MFVQRCEDSCLVTRENISNLFEVWQGNRDASRVVSGTRDIFSSYGGDGPSKLVFVQRSQDSCLAARDTSGFSSRLGMAIGTPL